MKILHLLDIPWWSGLSSYAMDCAMAHRSLGHTVILACERGSLFEERAIALGFGPRSIGGRSAFHALGNVIKTGRIVISEKPDWIVAHTGSTHWIAALWAACSGAQLIRTRATAQNVKSSIINRTLYSRCRWVVTVSQKLKSDSAQRLGVEAGNNMVVLAPPVEEPQTNGAAPVALGPSVGMVARLDPVKGHSVFLEAARKVQEKFPGASFHLAGAEENLRWPDLLKQARLLGLRNLRYHGFVDEKGVWAFMRSCSVGAICSTGSEEVSRALLEWMSSGKPVAASKVGGIPEMLKDGENGFLVEPGNATALANAILRLLSDPALSAKMGSFGRTLARERYSRKAFESAWEDLLRD